MTDTITLSRAELAALISAATEKALARRRRIRTLDDRGPIAAFASRLPPGTLVRASELRAAFVATLPPGARPPTAARFGSVLRATPGIHHVHMESGSFYERVT